MNQLDDDAVYEMLPTAPDVRGRRTLELLCMKAQKIECVGRVSFVEDSGQFYIQTFGDELPLDLVEELIAEARRVMTSSSS